MREMSHTGFTGILFRCLLFVFVFIDRFDPGRFSMSRCGDLLFGHSNDESSYKHAYINSEIVVDVITLTHRYNAVLGHRTGSNNSGAEYYLRRKTKNKQKIIHTITETNRIPQTKIKRRDQRTYQETYHMLNEPQQKLKPKPKPRRQHSTHKKKTG